MVLEDILDVAELMGYDRAVVERKIQKRYATYVGRGRLDHLRSLQEVTGIEPSEDVVQWGYAIYVREERFHCLRSLQKMTGIEPELSEDVVQEGYAIYVREGRFDDLRSLQEVTGIKPSEDIYKAFLESL